MLKLDVFHITVRSRFVLLTEACAGHIHPSIHPYMRMQSHLQLQCSQAAHLPWRQLLSSRCSGLEKLQHIFFVACATT